MTPEQENQMKEDWNLEGGSGNPPESFRAPWTCQQGRIDALTARVTEAENKQKIDEDQCDRMTSEACRLATLVINLTARAEAAEKDCDCLGKERIEWQRKNGLLEAQLAKQASKLEAAERERDALIVACDIAAQQLSEQKMRANVTHELANNLDKVYREACTQLSEQAAVIERLPKTVDGVRYIDGDELWLWCDDGEGNQALLCFSYYPNADEEVRWLHIKKDTDPSWVSDLDTHDWQWLEIGNPFSTRESAIAAQKGKKS